MKTRIVSYLQTEPVYRTDQQAKLWIYYKVEWKKWFISPWKTLFHGIQTKEEAIEIQKKVNLIGIIDIEQNKEAKTIKQEVKQKTQDHATTDLVYMLRGYYINRRKQIFIAKDLGMSQSMVSIKMHQWIKQQIQKEFPTKPQQSPLLP